ncbi:ribonuclease HII [Candidatus Woesearchaeota archaeon]|nr:ribonuclease HII [Candidatus Woesearchaeota archaeon]
MALVCGIDEAGRGPIIGPMVMSGVLVAEEKLQQLRDMGVKDSKLLTLRKMEHLYDKIIELAADYAIVIIPPEEIDAALSSADLNLNWLEATKSLDIIHRLKPDQVIIDSPSNNVKAYKSYIMERLKVSCTVLVEHKADVNYIECSAASVLAKVTREREIAALKKKYHIDFGSGYLTDPKTIAFLEKYYENYNFFRKSWKPYQKLVRGKLQKTLKGYTSKAEPALKP